MGQGKGVGYECVCEVVSDSLRTTTGLGSKPAGYGRRNPNNAEGTSQANSLAVQIGASKNRRKESSLKKKTNLYHLAPAHPRRHGFQHL